jgi:hypothetical protein
MIDVKNHLTVIKGKILFYFSFFQKKQKFSLRFSPSTQKSDILYSSNVTELDPPKCVVCMVRISKDKKKILTKIHKK